MVELDADHPGFQDSEYRARRDQVAGLAALSGAAEIRSFDPELAKDTAYPITSFQPLLWSVDSIQHAFERMAEFVRWTGV